MYVCVLCARVLFACAMYVLCIPGIFMLTDVVCSMYVIGCEVCSVVLCCIVCCCCVIVLKCCFVLLCASLCVVLCVLRVVGCCHR